MTKQTLEFGAVTRRKLFQTRAMSKKYAATIVW